MDAFEEPGRLREHTTGFLKALQSETGAEIEPVYVLSPTELNISLEFSAPWLQQYRPAAEKAITQLIEELGIPGILPPKILLENLGTTSHAVDAISEYAERAGAELVLVGSHGKKGFARFFLGSFAENLLNRCRVPVIVIGSNVQTQPEIKHVLFPTEFGSHGRLMYRRVVALCRDFGAGLTLFHAIPHPVQSVFQSGVYLLGGSWIPIQSYLNSAFERQQKRADAWVRWARNQGVQAECVIDNGGTSVVDAIIRTAKERNTSLIAMEAQSGPIAAAFLGSITRHVVRGAECPVWVLRSSFVEAQLHPHPKAA